MAAVKCSLHVRVVRKAVNPQTVAQGGARHAADRAHRRAAGGGLEERQC